MSMPANDVPLFEVLYQCRAMRRLKPDPVPESVLLQLTADRRPATRAREETAPPDFLLRTQARRRPSFRRFGLPSKNPAPSKNPGAGPAIRTSF